MDFDDTNVMIVVILIVTIELRMSFKNLKFSVAVALSPALFSMRVNDLFCGTYSSLMHVIVTLDHA